MTATQIQKEEIVKIRNLVKHFLVENSDDVVRDLTTWSLFADEYPNSPARALSLRAFDCLGTEIPLAGL